MNVNSHLSQISLHTRPISDQIFGTEQQFSSLAFYFLLAVDLESQLKKPRVYIGGTGKHERAWKINRSDHGRN